MTGGVGWCKFAGIATSGLFAPYICKVTVWPLHFKCEGVAGKRKKKVKLKLINENISFLLTLTGKDT